MTEQDLRFDELTFEESRHIYRLNGIEIPSVTTLLQPLSDEFYKTVSRGTLDNAANKGTAVHDACENYANFGIVDIAPEYRGYFNGFQAWWIKNRPKVIATEVRLYHKVLMYAGTADLICEINGERVVVDYKTLYQLNEKLCGPQLEGYDWALESHGFKTDRRMILHLRRDGSYGVHWFPKEREYRDVLHSLLKVHNYKQKF